MREERASGLLIRITSSVGMYIRECVVDGGTKFVHSMSTLAVEIGRHKGF